MCEGKKGQGFLLWIKKDNQVATQFQMQKRKAQATIWLFFPWGGKN